MTSVRRTSPHSPATFAQYLAGAFVRWPARVAFDELDRQYTYREVAQRIAQMMSVLSRGRGIRRRGVAICSVNAMDTWAAIAAVKMSGGYVVSLSSRGSPEDLATFITDGDAEILIIHSELEELGAAIIATGVTLSQVFTIGSSQLAPDLVAEAGNEAVGRLRPAADLQPDDVCEIKFTGGTTGISKGAAHTQWSTLLCSLTLPAGMQMPYGGRYLCSAPISHSGYPWIAPTLFHGGTVVINKTFEPELFIRTVEEKRITLVQAVPTMIYKLLDVAATRNLDFSSVEAFMYGAAPISPSRLQEAHDRFGQVFAQIYGCVEALGVGMNLPRGMHDPNRPDWLMSCGLPAPGVSATLLDDDGNELGDGEVGEICLRTAAAMKEYWKKPEETAIAFAHGWLHTGDLATRSEEGLYTIVDRKKDVIVTGGFNVFSPQVESVIAADPSVSSVAVFGVPDPIWGEAVKAVVVPAAGKIVDPEHIQALVRAKKGPVNTPKSVDIVTDIPLTNLGKIDKRALRERYWGKGRRVN